ncbi:MAG: CxxC-x17-CxxC domain-containing protein [Patescibacteria group bacterium]
MYSVNATCAGCGAQITELPFQPTGDKPVYCRDCMVARRNNG